MNEILSEIKPDIVEKVPSPYFRWIVLGTILVIVLIIIYITFFQKKNENMSSLPRRDEEQSGREKKTNVTGINSSPLRSNGEKLDEKREKENIEPEKNKEIKNEIFGEDKPTPEDAKKLTEAFNEESSEEIEN